MKYILISNNPYISDELIESIKIDPEDIIIVFNHQYPMKFKKISNHKNIIVLMRYNNRDKVLGFREYKFNAKKYSHVLIFNETRNSFKPSIYYDTIHQIKNKYYNISDDYYELMQNNNISYPINGQPTTGFVGFIFFNYIHQLKNNFVPGEIQLVGFTGIYNGHLLTNYHRCDYEQDFYHKLKVKILNNNKNIKENLNLSIIKKKDDTNNKNLTKQQMIKENRKLVNTILLK